MASGTGRPEAEFLLVALIIISWQAFTSMAAAQAKPNAVKLPQPEQTSSGKSKQEKNPPAQLLKAQALARAGKLEEARGLTADFVKINPAALEGLAFLATLDENIGDYDAAHASYGRMLVIEPELWQAQLGLARCCLKLSKYKEAIRLLTNLTIQHPDEAKIWLNLAIAKLETGELDEAEEAAKKAILYEPDSVTPVKVLAEVKFNSTQFRYARELGLAILMKQPDKTENYQFLLRCMAYTKSQPEELNDLVDLVLEKMPTNSRAKLFYELGRQGELHARAVRVGTSTLLARRKNAWYLVAARAFELASRNDANNANYHLQLANVLSVLKMKQVALLEAEKATRLDPSLKLGPQLQASCAAARRDIAGRIKISLSHSSL